MDNLAATRQFIRLALEEDIGKGDATALCVPPEVQAKARLIAKKDTVLSGLDLVPLVLESYGSQAIYEISNNSKNGMLVRAGTEVLKIQGLARDLLTTERTILNFLQHLCGIATQASELKTVLGSSSMKILDTRKTTPGMRYWEKCAVKDGGLWNHRMRLDDGVLIKENHIRASGSITLALANLHGKIDPSLPIQVEVTTLEEAEEAIQCGVKRLLLDNFSPNDLSSIVKALRAKGDFFLEASGGIDRDNLKAYAATGVDAVSMGMLTHSVKAADLSLLFEFNS
ncbi:MAG: carboxylating nicotinate-nucleotide diphosphorylase [Oligoflexia bacterium]|nr:carboxylating nicotinate-nucleotide diphosphorylase [Oligoflexia bacterium]